MKKFGRARILDVLECAKKKLIDCDSLCYVSFDYHGHRVLAFFDPIPNDFGWVLTYFMVIYSRCVMYYSLGVDYDDTDGYLDYRSQLQ